jgi:hypothetical protein
MADLSPQAQAVYDAYCEGADNPYSYDGGGLVAALRAVAEQIETLYCDSDVNDSPGIVFALRQLILIANELEAQPDD